MIKKNIKGYIRRAVASAMICIMALSLDACGQKESKIVSGSSILPMPTNKAQEVTVPVNANEVTFYRSINIYQY